jgi:uncharacterized protein
MIELIEQQRDAIRGLCREYRVRRLDLFGSAARDDFDPATSDLDFVVVFNDAGSPGYADRYLGFVEALEALFDRSVDLLTENMIQNPYFRQDVEASRTVIYEERDTSAAA